ncbi:hypothetical protein V1477_010891 [Vespula maculifrons]|uniref:Uncharacterized protein n=1 Tax=Vespula maculifrons TaxID=7453 RepID=A0ABD2C377_VESMC
MGSVLLCTATSKHRHSHTVFSTSINKPMGLQMQQPPRGETWVGGTCNISKSNSMQVLPGEWLHILIYFQNLINLILILI